jgi:hypothetical protein
VAAGMEEGCASMRCFLSGARPVPRPSITRSLIEEGYRPFKKRRIAGPEGVPLAGEGGGARPTHAGL